MAISAAAVGAEWSTFGVGLTFEVPEALLGIGAAIEAIGGGASAGVALVAAAVSLNPFADLVGFIVALVLLIVAFAISILLLKPLGHLLGAIPLVGGAIEGAVEGASNAIWNFVTSLVHNGLLMIWHLIKLLWAITFGLPGTIAQGFAVVAGTINFVRTQLIPWVHAEALQLSHAAEARADAFASSAAASVLGVSRSLFSAALNEARNLFHAAEATAAAEVAQVAHEAESLFRTAETVAAADMARVTALLHAEVGMLQHLVAQTLTRAEGDIAAAETRIHTDIGHVVDTLTGLITGSITATTLTLTREITGVRTEASTATKTVADEFDNYMKRCGIKVCSGLGNLADDFNLLLEAFGIGALLALLAAILHDPQAVARDLEEFVGRPAEAAVSFVLGEAA